MARSRRAGSRVRHYVGQSKTAGQSHGHL